MKYKITHTTKYGYTDAVPVCHNQLHLAPRQLGRQTCSDFRLIVHPEPTTIGQRLDYFGNQVNFFSIDNPHRGLTVTAKSNVEVFGNTIDAKVDSLPWETIARQLQADHSETGLEKWQFVFPSPAIVVGQSLRTLAEESFTGGRPILEAVMDLTARIHEQFEYDSTATTTHTPMTEVLANRRGVCQDFAHLQIGCLRSLGLAARYVSGYLRTYPPAGKPRLVGADASHAWLSVFCGSLGWVDVDPTNNMRTSQDHITVAWGRDYTDVCPVQGVIVGGGEHTMDVSVDVLPLSEPSVP